MSDTTSSNAMPGGSTNDVVSALDFLQSSKQVSSEVVQALRQAVDVFSQQARSHPASGAHLEEDDAQAESSTKRKFKPASSKRQQLTAEEAAEIYISRPQGSGEGDRPKRGSMILCKQMGPKYGVSAKTIRDIWRGRTWVEATKHLWTPEERERREAGGADESDSGEEGTGEERTQTAPAPKKKKTTKSAGQTHAPTSTQQTKDMYQSISSIPSQSTFQVHGSGPMQSPATAPPHAQMLLPNFPFNPMGLSAASSVSSGNSLEQMMRLNSNYVPVQSHFSQRWSSLPPTSAPTANPSSLPDVTDSMHAFPGQMYRAGGGSAAHFGHSGSSMAIATAQGNRTAMDMTYPAMHPTARGPPFHFDMGGQGRYPAQCFAPPGGGPPPAGMGPTGSLSHRPQHPSQPGPAGGPMTGSPGVMTAPAGGHSAAHRPAGMSMGPGQHQSAGGGSPMMMGPQPAPPLGHIGSMVAQPPLMGQAGPHSHTHTGMLMGQSMVQSGSTQLMGQPAQPLGQPTQPMGQPAQPGKPTSLIGPGGPVMGHPAGAAMTGPAQAAAAAAGASMGGVRTSAVGGGGGPGPAGVLMGPGGQLGPCMMGRVAPSMAAGPGGAAAGFAGFAGGGQVGVAGAPTGPAAVFGPAGWHGSSAAAAHGQGVGGGAAPAAGGVGGPPA